jgi:ATP-dependent Zn protease
LRLRPPARYHNCLAAYHEAGHAVARLATGGRVHRVAIAEDGTGHTCALTLRSCPSPINDAICALAGPAAEAAAAGCSLAEVLTGSTGSTDLDMARAALAQDPYRTSLRTAAALATSLIQEHAVAVATVARALLDRGALDEDALATIMRGRGWPR